ncbi:hypothetical protein CLV98_103416 [Dyadobacter jejuensis]|uniref:Uncharacterized protein n=1 Tax=Dyadobacter jejuensis TaxID=1082580 RepID=A0A316AMT5_9BACT|nr:hypothetical protein [Dyadobacter jejuensis]PWJ59043.1 hypothetical protein CLV98_103416 [Dyadobacter jejuensis]
MKHRGYYWIGLVLALALYVSGQIGYAQEIKRIEIPTEGNTESIQTIPLGHEGVIVVSKPNKGAFLVQKFNSELSNIWSIEGPIEPSLQFISSSFDGHSVFLLFGKNRSVYYTIVKVNIGPGFLETFQIETVAKFEITDFVTLGYSMFMAGTIRNEAVLLHSRLDNAQTRLLPTAIKGSTVIQSLELDAVNRLVNVNFAIKKNRQTKIMVRAYTEDGQQAIEIQQTPDQDYSLLNGRIQILNDSTQLLVGTYGYRNMQSSNASASQGLYISKFIRQKEVYTRYHSFTDFENFFSYMNDRQQEKLERRIDRKKESGQDLKLNYRLLMHDLKPDGENFLLTAEVFYPEFTYRTSGMGSGYSNLMGYSFGRGLYNPYLYNPMYAGRGYNQQVFDGFTYTHAIIAGISPKGDLLWDNSISFDEMKSMELRQKIKVQNEPNGQLTVAYSKEGSIKTTVIQQDKVISAERSITVPSTHAGDKIKKTTTDDVDYWFDQYFLAWGVQRITNNKASEQNRGRRNVFYLTKLAF